MRKAEGPLPDCRLLVLVSSHGRKQRNRAPVVLRGPLIPFTRNSSLTTSSLVTLLITLPPSHCGGQVLT